jgi:hypothetical protein
MMLRTARILGAVASPFILAGTILGVTRLFSSRPLPALVAPLLTVDPSVFEKQSTPGEVISAEFTIHNDTDRSVKLLGYSSSCTCVTMSDSFPLVLAARGTVVLHAQLAIPLEARDRYRKEFSLVTDRAGLSPDLIIVAILSTSPNSGG